MVTPSQALKLFGPPDVKFERKHMVLWDVPADINAAIPAIPNKIYCNKRMVIPLENALRNTIIRNVAKEIRTWDGCFNVRKGRGLSSMSLHSWGIAVDLNAAWNGLGKTPTFSAKFVQCFRDAAFDWGGDWKRKDGMHFQLQVI